MEDFFNAGGLAALLKEMSPLLELDTPTVTGQTLGESIAGAAVHNTSVIRTLDSPVHDEGGLAVVRGSLAPTGAVLKQTAASPDLLRHRGRAVVFEDHDDLDRRIDSDDLDVRPDDVLVMKGAGR